MQSPVLFLVFNRPGPTEKVFSRIKEARPPRLYIACDGPREGNERDITNIEKVKYICSRVDWDCNVKTLYRACNLGCGLSVSSAIDWFFSREEEGIILEDDCLPSHSFFRFCDEMLHLHRENESVYLIAGYNKMQRWRDAECDYFYSLLGGIWGWATWKRAWSHYDFNMTSLNSLLESNYFVNHLGHSLGLRRQKQLVDARSAIHSGKLDTWDYQWACTRHANNGLSCVPAKSLIKNIGFAEDATHTSKGSDSVFQEDLIFPLRQNHVLKPDLDFDSRLLTPIPFWKRALLKLKTFPQ
jgi:hypothetical protein